MNKKAKLYLIISLVLVVVGLVLTLFTHAADHPQIYVLLPTGAVFFGLFLVSAFLADEAEQHTKEQDEFVKRADGKSGKA